MASLDEFEAKMLAMLENPLVVDGITAEKALANAVEQVNLSGTAAGWAMVSVALNLQEVVNFARAGLIADLKEE